MVTDKDREIGNRVRKLRCFKGMTNAEAFSTLLAEHGLFIRATTLKRMEVGLKHISPERLEKIAKALGCTADYLSTGDNPPCSVDFAKPGVKLPCETVPAEHKRGVKEYEAAAALAVPSDPHTTGFGGDMADTAIQWADMVVKSIEPRASIEQVLSPIQEVDSRLQARYPAGKVPVPRDIYGHEEDGKLVAAGMVIILISAVAVVIAAAVWG